MTLKIRRAPNATGAADHRLALVEFVDAADDPADASAIYRCARTGGIWRKGELRVQWAIQPPPGTQMVSLLLLEGDDNLREDDVLRPLPRSAAMKYRLVLVGTPVRAYELAAELGLDLAALTERAAALGIEIGNPMTVLEAEQADRIRGQQAEDS